MATFDEQKTVVDVPTVKDIKRFVQVVNEDHLDEEGNPDGGPDLDIFVYVGSNRTKDRRQVPRAKVIAGWPGGLKAELVKMFNNAE